ncbi:MAG: hypothetical protein ACK4VN_07225, partial [Bacteroidales bacterium]
GVPILPDAIAFSIGICPRWGRWFQPGSFQLLRKLEVPGLWRNWRLAQQFPASGFLRRPQFHPSQSVKICSRKIKPYLCNSIQ